MTTHTAGRPPVRSVLTRLPDEAAASGLGAGPYPAATSLARAPIDSLPFDDPDPDMLAASVHHRTREPGTDVPTAVTAALWVLLAFDLAFGGWLVAVRSGAADCSGTLCAVATLGDRPVLALALAAICVSALLALIPITEGLTRVAWPHITAAVLAALCGIVALAGVIALLLFVALCLVVVFWMFVAVVDRL